VTTEEEDAAFIDRLYGDDGDDDLDGFRGVRSLIARVRSEAPEPEPAQAITARLLLAAEEHAPKRSAATVRPGVWARILGWLGPLSAHPGVLAAATLVVVAGAVVVWKQRPAEPQYRADAPTQKEAKRPAAAEEKKEASRDESNKAGAEAEKLESGGQVVPTSPPPQSPERPRKDARAKKKQEIKAPPEPEPDRGPTGGDPITDGEGTTTADSPPPPPPKADPQPKQEKRDRKTDAERLTDDARTAAKQGNCAQVDELGGRVNELDPSYYKAVFEKDPSIKACRTAR
jgi:hypothetical protein